MKTSAEFEIKVSGGRITKAQVMPDGSCDATCHKQKDLFKKVPASELRLNDVFMKHHPRTKAERDFKKRVEIAIEYGLKDFWCPVYDPSFEPGARICYEPGKIPAVGKDYDWWEKTAKNFCPESGSRLGTKSERVAFLAVLIKDLVASGWKVADAWNAVCNDSKKLGHYWNSKNAKHFFEPTGSREVCGWYDLANNYKILKEDEKDGAFWVAGGSCGHYSYDRPLADLEHSFIRGNVSLHSCGWLVLTEGSTDH